MNIEDQIDNMEVGELLALIEQVEEYQKYNAGLTFKPYPFQQLMYAKGKEFRSRFACLANR